MEKKPSPYRLGLDVGTSSVGWCLLSLDSNNNPQSIIRSGVRIFAEGRDQKSKTTLNASRREARMARRQRKRYLQRRTYLVTLLVRHQLMPGEASERRKLVPLDPYELRARALDQSLPPHHTGRALFHLNQRRGFRSNRKSDAQEKEGKVIQDSIKQFRKEMEEQNVTTLGSFLARRHKKRRPVLARRQGTGATDLYQIYPERSMLQEEFDQIWASQARWHPSVFTEQAKKEIREAIFFQRELKPPIRGKCQFLPEEERAPRALPSYQRFRIRQDVNHLKWIDSEGHPHSLEPELQKDICRHLEKKKSQSFNSLRTDLKKKGICDGEVRFNLETERVAKLSGNTTSYHCSEYIGKQWHTWPLDKQDRWVRLLIDTELNDDEVKKSFKEDWGLSLEQAEQCVDSLTNKLDSGYSKLSEEAIGRILPEMEKGLLYSEAIQAAGLGHHSDRSFKGEILPELPYYGELLKADVTNDTQKLEDEVEKRYGRIPNPTVHIALNQIRRIVNELIKIYGHPKQLVIELARDIARGAEARKKKEREQTENQERNKLWGEKLNEIGVDNQSRNRLLLRLWEELDLKNCNNRRCPYTGEQINIQKLFSAEVEIDHILPFSRTLDDGIANKTLCVRKANRDKGERSPHEAFGTNPAGYSWPSILERAEKLPAYKYSRFLAEAMENFIGNNKDFLARQLNDTRYISRICQKYLQHVCRDIWVVPGRMTSLLRWITMKRQKDRLDHRHHAIDAAIIAISDRGTLNRLARIAKKNESHDLMAWIRDQWEPPWKNFPAELRKSIESIVVSHKHRDLPEGQLHKETAYGIAASNRFVHRVALQMLKKTQVGYIRDPKIHQMLQEAVKNKEGQAFSQAMQDFSQRTRIRSVRISENKEKNMILLKDKAGKEYKAYAGDSNWAYEIYEKPDGKWGGEIINRFDANQKRIKRKWKKDHPIAPLIMRLQINDMVVWQDENKQTNRIMRVQKISDRIVVLADHFEANTDQRDRDRNDKFSFIRKSPDALRKLEVRQIHVSPAGRVSIKETKAIAS